MTSFLRREPSDSLLASQSSSQSVRTRDAWAYAGQFAAITGAATVNIVAALVLGINAYAAYGSSIARPLLVYALMDSAINLHMASQNLLPRRAILGIKMAAGALASATSLLLFAAGARSDQETWVVAGLGGAAVIGLSLFGGIDAGLIGRGRVREAALLRLATALTVGVLSLIGAIVGDVSGLLSGVASSYAVATLVGTALLSEHTQPPRWSILLRGLAAGIFRYGVAVAPQAAVSNGVVVVAAAFFPDTVVAATRFATGLALGLYALSPLPQAYLVSAYAFSGDPKTASTRQDVNRALPSLGVAVALALALCTAVLPWLFVVWPVFSPSLTGGLPFVPPLVFGLATITALYTLGSRAGFQVRGWRDLVVVGALTVSLPWLFGGTTGLLGGCSLGFMFASILETSRRKGAILALLGGWVGAWIAFGLARNQSAFGIGLVIVGIGLLIWSARRYVRETRGA